jgi:hypothetical protein
MSGWELEETKKTKISFHLKLEVPMVTKRTIVILFSVLLAVMLVTSTASARPLADALGTSFTYQGKLMDGGAPANGTYDFQFSLYNALSGGTQVGSTVSLGDVAVTAGLFTVQLDFGNVFDGTALYLQIAVRPGASVGAYTTLTPRQLLSATPYAFYAQQAGNAALLGGNQAGNASGNVPLNNGTVNTNLNADLLDGQHAGNASGSVPLNNGTVNTNLNADLLDGLHASAFAQALKNVIVVAKSGGNYTTITAALNSITDASDTNRYLVYVAPGVYSEQVQMKPYVDIEGAGELTTKITWTSTSETSGTVVGANNAELRFLTVENTGGFYYATAIYNSSASPRLTHVTASASGASIAATGVENEASTPKMSNVTIIVNGSGSSDTTGIENHSYSSSLLMIMENVSVKASGGDYSYGIINSGTSPTMTNVTASASSAVIYAWGIYNTSASPTMTNVTASASDGGYSYGIYNYGSSPAMTNVIANASEGTNNIGVFNTNSSAPTMMSVTASASGGTSDYGVENVNSSSPTMTNVTASASAGTNNYGVYNTGTPPTMTSVTASASGGTNAYGVYNDSVSPTMTNGTASASGGTNNYGVYNTFSSPAMTNGTAKASGGTNNYGVYNSTSSPSMTGVTASASGGTKAYGVENDSGSSPTMTSVTASASGGTSDYGVWNDSSSLTLQNSVISASGGTNDGIHNVASSGTWTVKITNSQITGSTSTIYSSISSYTVQLASSQLIGSGVQGSGTYLCVFSYNGSYVALSSTCH